MFNLVKDFNSIPSGHSHFADDASPEPVGGAVGLVSHHLGAAAATVIQLTGRVTQKLPDDEEDEDDKTRLPGKKRKCVSSSE